MRVIHGAAAASVMFVRMAYGQFSPGELSKAHEQLEGMQNCAQCHEVGKEISGQKCLVCHTEIKVGLLEKHGYHFSVSSKRCTACHKEHLGRDAQTMTFNKRTFDHAATGFALTGKHVSVNCENCHARKNIKNAGIVNTLLRKQRATYLGLITACVGCHEDRHRGTVGVECQSCHTTGAWSPASRFDHTKTRYPLVGRHVTVQCNKCHNGPSQSGKDSLLILPAKSFRDCSPCHVSPHSQKFTGQACSSCHTPQGWRGAKPGEFDHNLTSFKLVGKHAKVECQKCHKGAGKASFASAFKLPHDRCLDCHADYHKGEFREKYRDDCLRCHTQETFQVATFTLAAHQQSRFPLNGAHSAIPCANCHVVAEDGHARFRFESLQCRSCHRDKHVGQFADSTGNTVCENCHTTQDWKAGKFDHAKTRFGLVGKHASTRCESCHKNARRNGQNAVQYRGVDTACESCHKEVHAGQFIVNGGTDCQRCHVARSWTQLIFDHNVQSAFPLAGAHVKVPCRSCHREEKGVGGVMFLRFKPVSSKCEVCHH